MTTELQPVVPPEVLDCTLRDGSYSIDFQFTTDETAAVCSALSRAGFQWIEIGHGLGLGATSQKHGVASASDRAYVEAAVSVAGNSLVGAFFIPGIGTHENLDEAVEAGLSFVRIGTNGSDVPEAKPFVQHARALGLSVMYNVMKSYLLSPEEFLDIAIRVADWGVEAVYLVDSAGTMLPSEVSAYVEALRQGSGIRTGFHGHNNLMLAHANCIAALEAGADLVDGTLQGIGRSSGNAQTEILVGLLDRLGLESPVDIARTMEAGELLIRPRMEIQRGIDSVEATMGLAGLHSKYLPLARRIAGETGVDLHELIRRVCTVDRNDPGEPLMRELANELIRENADQ
jgi:4-hydroxy-2-oxovalerate aldolase